MSKLTLSVDSSVVSRAKKFAKQQGLSVSQIVETYLTLVSKPIDVERAPPVLRSVRGSLKKGDLADYRAHLTKKFR
ncbi:MAG: DUF6364 family protein [Acidobacteriota bacterium]|nr:DUF6364 family protein [Acidobacteriota bacterium]